MYVKHIFNYNVYCLPGYKSVLENNYEIVYDTCIAKYCFIYFKYSLDNQYWFHTGNFKGAWTLKINRDGHCFVVKKK